MLVFLALIQAQQFDVANSFEVGARVGRLSKLMKCLSYYLREKDKNMDMHAAQKLLTRYEEPEYARVSRASNSLNVRSSNPAEAKKLSTRLMMTLSTKAGCFHHAHFTCACPMAAGVVPDHFVGACGAIVHNWTIPRAGFGDCVWFEENFASG